MYQLSKISVLRVIQITDTHLLADHNASLLGIPTQQSLAAVVDHIQQHHSSIDALLLTGDLSQDGSRQSYEILETQMARLPAPSFWIPGNHDRPDMLKQWLCQSPFGQKQILSEHWQIIMLNSQVVGETYGQLATSELEFLTEALEQYPNHHTLIAMHHHPISIASRWMDDISLRNQQQLSDLLEHHQQIKAAIWGHVHQHRDQQFEQIRFMSCPSTCVQFKPESDDFALDELGPGYRWLELNSDGTIHSGVERLSASLFPHDLSASGY